MKLLKFISQLPSIYKSWLEVEKLDHEKATRIRRQLQWFCEDNNISFFDWGIFSIDTIKENGCIVANITLSRPGLFIGKGGELFYRILKSFDGVFDLPVKINLIEHRLK